MKNKQMLNGFLIGILIGATMGIFVYRFFSRSEPYSIHTTGGGGALKINKRTGETWTTYEGKWNPVATETSSNLSHTGDWLERLLCGLIGALLTVLGFVLSSIWKKPRQDSNQQHPPMDKKISNG